MGDNPARLAHADVGINRDSEQDTGFHLR